MGLRNWIRNKLYRSSLPDDDAKKTVDAAIATATSNNSKFSISARAYKALVERLRDIEPIDSKALAENLASIARGNPKGINLALLNQEFNNIIATHQSSPSTQQHSTATVAPSAIISHELEKELRSHDLSSFPIPPYTDCLEEEMLLFEAQSYNNAVKSFLAGERTEQNYNKKSLGYHKDELLSSVNNYRKKIGQPSISDVNEAMNFTIEIADVLKKNPKMQTPRKKNEMLDLEGHYKEYQRTLRAYKNPQDKDNIEDLEEGLKYRARSFIALSSEKGITEALSNNEDLSDLRAQAESQYGLVADKVKEEKSKLAENQKAITDLVKRRVKMAEVVRETSVPTYQHNVHPTSTPTARSQSARGRS